MRHVRAVGAGLFGLSLLAGLGLGVGGSALAQQAGGINFIELFTQLDANGDLVIEKGEVPESGQAAFEQLLKHADKNKDGKIDREEYRDVIMSLRDAGPGAGAGAGMTQAARFQQMDTNKDGKVSRDEFNGPENVFENLDADKDGFLTREEAAKFPAPGLGVGMMVQRLVEMDTNKDGKVSRDEFNGRAAMFDRLDADKDGFVTREEATRGLGFGPGPGPGGGVGTGFQAPRFREMDTNKDGKISRDEFTGPPPRFNQIDADKDGFLTPAEVRQFFPTEQPATKKAGAAKKKDKENPDPEAK